MLLDRLLEPAPPKPGSMQMGIPTLRFAGQEWWMRPWWEQELLPGLAGRHLAEQTISLLDGRLREAHRIAAAWRGDPEVGAQAISLDRDAINQHEQEESRSSDGVGLLVDMARDSLEALLRHHPELGEAWLGVWTGSGAPLLRRLAVHGWAEREDAGPDQKVEWLARSGVTTDRLLRPEARHLAEKALPGAGQDAIRTLIAAISQPPGGGQSGKPEGGLSIQEIGDWLALAARSAPKSSYAQGRFESFELSNPSWRPGEPSGAAILLGGTGWHLPDQDGSGHTPMPEADHLISMDRRRPPASPRMGDRTPLIAQPVRRPPLARGGGFADHRSRPRPAGGRHRFARRAG